MKNILVQKGGLEGVRTGFVIIKKESEGMVILGVLKIINFLMLENNIYGSKSVFEGIFFMFLQVLFRKRGS